MNSLVRACIRLGQDLYIYAHGICRYQIIFIRNRQLEGQYFATYADTRCRKSGLRRLSVGQYDRNPVRLRPLIC